MNNFNKEKFDEALDRLETMRENQKFIFLASSEEAAEVMRELDPSQEICVIPQSLKIDNKNDNSLYEDLKVGLEQAIEIEKMKDKI